MATFISAHRKFKTWCGKRRIAFVEGRFQTDDQELIGYLRKIPEYGNSLIEGEKIEKRTNIVTDLRTAGLEDLKVKFREYEELKSKCLKLDGSARKDAIESDINRINELRIELELN